MAVGNSIQAYSTLTYTKRVYSALTKSDPDSKPASPVTPLSGRTFGTWTFVSALIRLYAAYNIDNPQMYQLALWSYVVAFGHFASEWLVFGTAKWGAGLAGPVMVSSVSMVWMLAQWGFYVK
jgi:Erg28 like protein